MRKLLLSALLLLSVVVLHAAPCNTWTVKLKMPDTRVLIADAFGVYHSLIQYVDITYTNTSPPTTVHIDMTQWDHYGQYFPIGNDAQITVCCASYHSYLDFFPELQIKSPSTVIFAHHFAPGHDEAGPSSIRSALWVVNHDIPGTCWYWYSLRDANIRGCSIYDE